MTLGSWVDDVLERNRGAVAEVAQAVVATHRQDGLVLSAGSGHSLAMVMETFFRAGGLARVRPLFLPEILPLVGARDATAAERVPGLGYRAIDAVGVTARDTVIIFSNSGRNPYPVEVAERARSVGAAVVAFTSVAASATSAPRAGARLFEVADIVLDTRTPLGDASEPPEDPVTSPLSTIACAALWSRVLAEVVSLDPSVPLWRSANRDGNDSYNESLVAALGAQIPEL